MAPRTGLFLGLSTVDLIYDLPRYPAEDSKTTARRLEICAGGMATNAAVAFAWLGGQAHLYSVLGGSALADLARRDLTGHGVIHHDLAPDSAILPRISSVWVSEGSGVRTIAGSPAPGAAAGAAARIPDDLHGAEIALFDGGEPGLAATVAARAKAAGRTTVFDGDIYSERLAALLPHIDIAICGASFATPEVGDFAATVDFFSTFGVRAIALTDGTAPIPYAERADLAAPWQIGEIAVTPARAVDTLAAGDMFHGAFCFFYGQNTRFVDALARAAKVAGASTEHFGPRAFMATHDPSAF